MEVEQKDNPQKDAIYHSNYDVERIRKLEVLQTIPQVNHQGVETKIEDQLKIYLDLLKQGKNYNNTCKSKREFSNMEYLNSQIQNLEIDEYGTNFPQEKFNLKGQYNDAYDFFDGISRRQVEMQGLMKPLEIANQHNNQRDDKSKSGNSLWDATADPGAGEDRYSVIKTK